MEVISVDKLEQAIRDYNHKKYSITDKDVERINGTIIEGFAEQYRIGNTNPERIRIDSTLGMYREPLYKTFAAFLFGNGEKAEMLKDQVEELIEKAGFETKAIPNKGLYIYIKQSED